MSQTQTNRPKRSHVFLLKLTLGIFVLIFIAMIVMNYMKSKGIAEYLANQGEKAVPVTAMTITTQQWTPVIETTGLVRPNQPVLACHPVRRTGGRRRFVAPATETRTGAL